MPHLWERGPVTNPERVLKRIDPRKILGDLKRELQEEFPGAQVVEEEGVIICEGEDPLELRLGVDADQPIREGQRRVPVRHLLFDRSHKQVFLFADRPNVIDFSDSFTRYRIDRTGLILGKDPEYLRLWCGYYMQCGEHFESTSEPIEPLQTIDGTIALVNATLENFIFGGLPL